MISLWVFFVLLKTEKTKSINWSITSLYMYCTNSELICLLWTECNSLLSFNIFPIELKLKSWLPTCLICSIRNQQYMVNFFFQSKFKRKISKYLKVPIQNYDRNLVWVAIYRAQSHFSYSMTSIDLWSHLVV